MTFQDFISKWNGKKLDYDGAFGAQCVDLYRQYCRDVLNVPQSPPVQGAADIWTTYDPKYFKRIPNTPLGIPKPGSIMIWGRSLSPSGHVGIFITGNLLYFNSFDQNFPVGSACHIQPHNYKNVLGWLEPIPQQATTNIKVARIGVNLPSADHFKSQVAQFTNGKVNIMAVDYPTTITSTGMLTQDDTYKFLGANTIKETFVQFYYQSPSAPFATTYTFPSKNKIISTLPNNVSDYTIDYEFANALWDYVNDYCNAGLGYQPDSNFPDQAFIQAKYNKVIPFLKGGDIN